MPAQILPIPGQRPPPASSIARYSRIGDDHKQSAGLHAGGRLPIDRAVVDSSRVERQRDLAIDLREADMNLVLDTEVAELATPAMHEQKGGEWTRCRPVARQPSSGPLIRRGRP